MTELKRKREVETTEEDANGDTPQYNKKKKQFVGRTTFVDETEEEDILVSGWFYLDQHGGQQGPYTTRDLKEWYIAGYLYPGTNVKRVYETDFKPIIQCDEFKRTEQRITTDVISYYQSQSAAEVTKAPTETVTAPIPEETPVVITPAVPEPEPEPLTTTDENFPDAFGPEDETLTDDEKLQWQQYQRQQQYQYYMYVQYCQKIQEAERAQQEANDQELLFQDQLYQQRKQQNALEAHIAQEKLEMARSMASNPYYGHIPKTAAEEAAEAEEAGEDEFEDTRELPPESASQPVTTIDNTYAQKAFFNSASGRYTAETPEDHFRTRRIPTDREGRMMAHYFDVEAYQDQMRQAAANPTKRPKVTKQMIKTYKKKKVDKQRRRILMIPS